MKNLLFFIVFLSMLKMEGQTIVRETLANGGDIYKNAQAGELSWTLGEISVETFSADTLKLTQGFQQIYLTIVPVFTQTNSNFKIYPNPANQFVFIENISPLVSNYQLTDALGKVLATGKIEADKVQLDVGQLNFGTYFINIFDKNQSVVSIHKIIKSTN